MSKWKLSSNNCLQYMLNEKEERISGWVCWARAKLDKPFVEYARYVLADGTDNERTTLAANMGPMLQIKNSELEFYNGKTI